MDGKKSYELKVSVPNKDALNKYINDLEMVLEVTSVERVLK